MVSMAVGEQTGPEIARLLLSVVVPRPIAWVSTIGADGTANLAPFSFFNAVSSRPPVVMVSAANRAESPKDTLRNAREVGEMVVHLVDEALAEAMNTTSTEWAYAVDEFAEAGLVAVAAEAVRPPRLVAAPVALECRVTDLIPIADSAYTMILGRVVQLHVRADLLRSNGLADASLMRPIARLGGDEYATIGRVFTMIRPTL